MLGACLFCLQLNVTTDLPLSMWKKDYKIYMNSNTVNYAYFKSWLISPQLTGPNSTANSIMASFQQQRPAVPQQGEYSQWGCFHSWDSFWIYNDPVSLLTQKPWLLRRWGSLSSGNSAFSNSLHMSRFFLVILCK